jgi:O-methyltransferase involved in polyketide biosynthesis
MTAPPDRDWLDLDTETPNPARMYDYLLGGAANFAADRAAVRHLLEINPQGRAHARANRAFLRRAVRYLAGHGVRQFLDLGSGVPTVGNVHEIAQQSAPGARVVYVDCEPIAALYSERVLAGVPGTTVIHDDIRNTERVLRDAGTVLDFEQPVAVLAFAVLHFVLDDTEVRRLLDTYRDHIVPGSWLAVSHVDADTSPAVLHGVREYRNTSLPARTRGRDEVAALFDGYDLVPPGVVPVARWRPEPGGEPAAIPAVLTGGLGRRR